MIATYLSEYIAPIRLRPNDWIKFEALLATIKAGDILRVERHGETVIIYINGDERLVSKT